MGNGENSTTTTVKRLRPKSRFDRTLATIARQRVWEFIPNAIKLEASIVNQAIEIAMDPNCPRPTKIRALNLAHKVLKESFEDRCLPTVHRVGALEAIAALPLRDGESESNPITDEDKARAEVVTLLKDVLTELRASSTQQVATTRPGLVLLRGDRAAG